MIDPTRSPRDQGVMISSTYTRDDQAEMETLFKEVRGSEPSTESYDAISIVNTEKEGKEKSKDSILTARCSLEDKVIVIATVFKTENRYAFIRYEIPIFELKFALIHKATNKAPSQLEGTMQHNIINADTLKAIEYTFEWAEAEEQSLDPSDGAVNIVSARRYGADEKERQVFNLLLGTKNIKWIERMLKDHSRAFARKRIEKIHCFRKTGVADHLYIEIGSQGKLGRDELMGDDWDSYLAAGNT